MDSKEAANEPFVDLTPISSSKDSCMYQQALDFCIGRDNVLNIALTGPYGSGKSSVIKGFKERRNADPSLNILEISLASFEGGNKQDDQTIESSILQQMLYSAASNTLPYSRFKRIQTPKKPYQKSLVFTLWLLILFVVTIFGKSFFSIHFDFLSGALLVLTVTALALGTWYFVSSLYMSFYGSPLKRISLKNLEAEREDSDASILNKYIDEILYFFEETQYNLVIFEDIDRFDVPEVFIKLREINTLLNQHECFKNQGSIQFLYALKDSTFDERERTKFFDFIISVVPVVGIANSIDIFMERIKCLPPLHRKIDETFVKDVSEYINDARIIHSIFNDLAIYIFAINDEKLDPTTLLAFMVYKNVFGQDFERLHDSKGAFFNIVSEKDNLISLRIADLKEQIDEKEQLITNAKQELLGSEKEIVSAYVAEIRKHSQVQALGLWVENKQISFGALGKKELIQLEGQGERLATWHHPQNNQRYNLGISLDAIKQEFKSNHSFEDRIEIISHKTAAKQSAVRREISKLQKEIDKIEHLSLADLLDYDTSKIDDSLKGELKFETNQDSNYRLFRFLLLSGYLNEDHHLYISIFRERDNWSAKDRLFLTTVRSRETPSPSMEIDHPKEVFIRLKPSDFKTKYVLNVDLIDYLLKESTSHPLQVNQALEVLSEYYESDFGRSFMDLYLSRQQSPKLLLDLIVENWPDYFSRCLDLPHPERELIELLQYAEVSLLKEHEEVSCLKNYLESNTAAIYVNEQYKAPTDNSYEFLCAIDLKIKELGPVKSNLDLTKVTRANNLYEINRDNIQFLLKLNNCNDEKVLRQTLFAIKSSGDGQLIKYVSSEMGNYIENVMLVCDENKDEPGEIIQELITDSGIDLALKKKLIAHQAYTFPNLDGVPELLWEKLLQLNKLSASWDSVFKCFNSPEVNHDILIQYLDSMNVVKDLKETPFLTSNRDETLKFRQFLYNATDLDDSVYIELNKLIKTTWKNFPTRVSHDKKILLASERLVSLNDESYEQTDEAKLLRAELIIANCNSFQSNLHKYKDTIHADTALKLFQANLPDNFKVDLCKIIDEEVLSWSDEITNVAAPHYLNLPEEYLNEGSLERLIVVASDQVVTLELFKIFRDKFDYEQSLKILSRKVLDWSTDTIKTALKLYPSPIRTLSVEGKRPVLHNTELNLELVSQLKKVGFISSFKKFSTTIEVNMKRKIF